MGYTVLFILGLVVGIVLIIWLIGETIKFFKNN
jgi:hypothetical protein